MKPKFYHPERFCAVLTGRKLTERTFVVRRHKFMVRVEDGFCFEDRNGKLWRPVMGPDGVAEYGSDGASIPHPIDWVLPAFDPLRYRMSSMGLHDPAYRSGMLECWDEARAEWVSVRVTKSEADSLLQQGVGAEGGWRVTRFCYWLFTPGWFWR
jgi:hypothetical protein